MHALAFSQAVPDGAKASAGHPGDAPVHRSTASQSFAAGRQMTPSPTKESPGQ
jgi:hypothetical protein